MNKFSWLYFAGKPGCQDVTMETEEFPKTKHGCSSSSGVNEESFVMVTLKSEIPSSSTSENVIESNPTRPVRTLERRLSSSSISSTDSRQSEAKYGHIHELENDFLLWFVNENEKEADIIFNFLEKEEQLRGFRYDRDKLVGRAKVMNISEAIKNSWKILLLISEDALEHNWFENQMYQSLTHDVNEERSIVVPILLRIDRRLLPTYLGSKYCLFYPSPPELNQSSSSSSASSAISASSTISASSASSSEPPSQMDKCVNSSSLQSQKESKSDIEMKRFKESLLRVFDSPPSLSPSPSASSDGRKRHNTSRSLSRSSSSEFSYSSSKSHKKKSSFSLKKKFSSKKKWNEAVYCKNYKLYILVYILKWILVSLHFCTICGSCV